MRQSDASIVHTSAQLKGRRLRMARALTGFSRQELFERIGIAISTIDTWESGRVELSQKSAERVCAAFKRVGISCSVQWLLTGCGDPPRIMDIVEKTMVEVGTSHNNSSKIEDIVLKSVSNSNICSDDKKISKISDSEIRHELSFFLSIHSGALFHIVEEDFANSQYKIGDCVAGISENILSLIGKNIIAILKDANKNSETILCKLLNRNEDGTYNIFINDKDDNKQVKILNAAEIIWHRTFKKAS